MTTADLLTKHRIHDGFSQHAAIPVVKAKVVPRGKGFDSISGFGLATEAGARTVKFFDNPGIAKRKSHNLYVWRRRTPGTIRG
jgi:hypothetical protein